MLKICEWCGNEFDDAFDHDTFCIEMFGLNFDNVRKCLCAECAIQAINEEVDGVYYETCEECGKTFDLILEKASFASAFPWYNGTKLTDHWNRKILCADCALVEVEKIPFG